MIKEIKELNFPAYATLETATAAISDMGDRTITSQVKIDGDVVPDFSYDWEVEFKGERYIHPVRTPQGTKDNASRKAKIDLVFYHWAIYEMKRQYFVEMASTSAGTAIADKYIASLGLNLGDFVTAFNLVLNHYFGGRIIINLNPEWQYDTEAKFVSISYSYIWDVLQQIYEIYGVRWTLKTNADGVCEILMGYPAEEVSHIFEYGFEGGLLSVQRQVQSTEIRNRLLGRGGEKNLPYRYFKDTDPDNPIFEADPDWIPELANITFTELRGKTFRDYVRGWKAKRYGGTPMDDPTEAYLAGYNAEKFDPIEYVDDKESIEKYGVLVGALENNEEIYPSIQGAPDDVDMIVDAEQVTDDDVDSAVENDSVTTNLESGHQTYRNAPANSTITIETLTKRYFSIPADKVGNLDMSLTVTGYYSHFGDYEETYPILKADTVKITIYDRNTDAIITSSTVPVINIPAGDYYYMISAEVETNYDKTSMVTLNIESVHLYTSTPDESEGWRPTFDIWVRNIWGSSREAGETDQQYADRVWLPILGDRMGDEARVVFASGWLSFSSDWEFPIVGYAFDDSKDGSEWRLTLAKSEAELEASGKYIPYEGYNASAGDRFFFIGIDMPHQYVLWGEERVDDYKCDRLIETAQINPSWVIKTDKVRLNQDRDGVKLIDSLSAGAQIRLASKQFISGAYESLYVQSMTYNWTSDTILYPDVEVVVSDKIATVKNPVAQIQGNIETLQRQVGSLSNIQQIIRQVCDQLYLRKDGIEDLSKSPTRFLGKVTGEKFRQGQIGGRDWGIYRDENGNAILEADKLVARQGILVSDLVVNEATYVGGLQINSAASMKITAVEETEDGYICYFDQQQGSVTNKFKVDDVALCQKFDPEDNEVKFYKRRVIAVAETSVALSKTDVNGDGVPAIDDEIIHYGNYTDKTRQYVIVRDVIGGGYERMLMGLDSVESDGVEYYFAGKSADSTARWFVGGTEQFAEYKDGQLTIKGNIFVTGSDKNISEQLAQIDFIREAFGENAQGLVLGTAIIVGYTDENENFVPMAGLSGVYDKDVENGGPAAWYGGTPEDAKSVIFMDGTGYFADGLFSWDKTQGINLGNGQLKINYDGSVEFGGNIRIGSTGEETLDSLLNIVAGLTDMWYLDDDGNVRTKHNVVIEGDTSSGGTGQDTPASGTVTGIRVDANTVLEPTAGIVDMSDVLANLEVDVDLSSYATHTDVNNAIAELVNGAPTTLDTLKEIADALAENEGVVEALESAIGTKADKTINITAGTGLSGGGTLASNVTLSLATSGVTAGTYPKVTVDKYGRVTAGATLVAGDIPALAISKITGLQTELDNRYTEAEVDTLLKKYLLLEATSQTITGDITINGNLIVTGDTSSGGEGSDTPASGTVTGVTVGSTDYTDVSAGLLDLTSLMILYTPLTTYNGLATRVSALEGKATAVSFTQTQTSGTKIGAITIDGVSTNIYTPTIPTSLPASDVYAWAKKSSLALADVPDLSSKYLPKSGGTIDGTNFSPLHIKSSTASYAGLGLRLSGSTYSAYLLYKGDTTWAVTGENWVGEKTLIHSGNIGDYNAAGLVEEVVTDLNSASSNRVFTMTSGYDSSAGNKPNTGWITGITLRVAQNDTYQVQIAASEDNKMYFRRENAGTWGTWKTIAFTDSDITGNAAGLKLGSTTLVQLSEGDVNILANLSLQSKTFAFRTSTYIVTGNSDYDSYWYGKSHNYKVGNTTAMLINSSGNVTIGASDLAGTSAKLYVNGHLNLGTAGTLISAKSGANKVIIDFGSAGDPYFGYGTASAGIATHICGNDIYLQYGTSRTNGLTLNSSGNVGIGITSPSYKLDVDGTVKATQYKSMYSSIQWTFGGGVLTDKDTNWALTNSATYQPYIVVDSENVRVGIDTQTPAYTLDVGGTGRFTGAVTMSSTLSVTGSIYTNGSLFMNKGGDGMYLTNTGIAFHNSSNAYAADIMYFSRTAITPYQSIIPGTNNTFTLGSSSYRWSAIYGGTGSYGDATNHVILNTTNVCINTTTTGGWVRRFSITQEGTQMISFGAYGNGATISYGYIGTNYTAPWVKLTSTDTTFYGNVIVSGSELRSSTPSGGSYPIWRIAHNTSNVFLQAGKVDGTSTAGNLYITGINASDLGLFAVYAPNSYFKGNVCPQTGNTYNLGTSSYMWSTTYTRYIDTASGYVLRFKVAGTEYMNLSTAGNLCIGNGSSTGSEKLHVYGNAIITGDTSSGSDIRFKDRIDDMAISLKDMANAPLFTFKWNDREDDTIHLGSSAQYWERITPQLVTGEDFKSLNYATLGVAMGISLAKKAVNHEERIKELEKEIKRLKEETEYGNMG